ncbi:MAG: hypothetical protein KIT54_10630 [Phycisphaeraceae bacterium]|nr:hypothetical protein [Phycisphaeraceae bacterium]
MAQKKSGLIKNVVLLMIVLACGVGVWYFLTKDAGKMNESSMRAWFESSQYVEEALDLDSMKKRLGHESPQDLGEGRFRFEMSQVNPKNRLIVEVVFRGNRAISHTLYGVPDDDR